MVWRLYADTTTRSARRNTHLTPRPAQRRGDGLLVREAPRRRVAEPHQRRFQGSREVPGPDEGQQPPPVALALRTGQVLERDVMLPRRRHGPQQLIIQFVHLPELAALVPDVGQVRRREGAPRLLARVPASATPFVVPNAFDASCILSLRQRDAINASVSRRFRTTKRTSLCDAQRAACSDPAAVRRPWDRGNHLNPLEQHLV